MKFIFALFLLATLVTADQWAVIVSGSSGFWNYRHQADACHAYQIHKAHGIPEDHIILLSYDDVANSSSNYFRGQLYNQPGENPPDVYDGCKITYREDDVTPEVYMAVLRGDAETVTKLTGKENPIVLKSTEKDTIFLSFFDHGGEYVICFPYSDLSADDLLNTFKYMYEKKMYNKMIYYLESCHSGSMFVNLAKDMNIYAVSASSPDESSWGYYCEDTDKVKNKTLSTCLGDLFAITWMEDCDLNNQDETLEMQWNAILERVTMSKPHRYGDKTYTKLPVWDFIGNGNVTKKNNLRQSKVNPRIKSFSKAISSRDIYYEYLKKQVSHAKNNNDYQLKLKELKKEENYRRVTDNRFKMLVKSITKDATIMNKLLSEKGTESKDRTCYYHVIDNYRKYCGIRTEYLLNYYSTMLNLCEYTHDEKLIINNLRQACGAIKP